jgi:cysteine desulfurase
MILNKMPREKRIYMDHAATTPVAPEVLEEMKPYFSERFGNASTLYFFGQEANKSMQSARKNIAGLMNAKPDEIIFTSGGTEADNTALKGIALAQREKGKGDHIITSAIEHHAILHTCDFLESQGFKVTRLPVDKDGLVNPADVERAITDKTILVSIMFANNEIGTVQPIEEIGRICKSKKVLFHTDAVQALGKLPIDVRKMNIDLLSGSAHKLYGPKGVGCLFVREGVEITPLLHGGGQELKRRATTENVAGIVGFGKACEMAQKSMKSEAERESGLRDMLIKEILEKIPDSYLNGHAEKRLPNNVHVRFKHIEGESLVLHLDMKGISASTQSACSSKSLQPSHVLLAIGLKAEDSHGSLRLTLGKESTKEQVEYVIPKLSEIVEYLRKVSPCT